MSKGHRGGITDAQKDLDHRESALFQQIKDQEAENRISDLGIKLENLKNKSAFLGETLEETKSGGGSSTGGGFQSSASTMNMGGTIALDRLYGKSEPGGIHTIFGMVAPSAGVATNLFTVLGKHTARVSVLWVANRRLISAKVRIGFDVAGGNTNIVPDEGWLYYNVKVPGESTLVLDAATGFWLGARDDVVVQTDTSGVSFGATGVEYATV